MISKILQLKNIGLFSNATQSSPIELDTAAIIYAENGRGKSTLASIFHACAMGDAERIKAQKTVDSNDEPRIELLIHDGESNKTILFSDAVWNTNFPEIMVFDSEFIDRNIYSGFEVGSAQKKGLLEFALGDDAVTLKNQLNEINRSMEQESKNRRDTESQLKHYRGPYLIDEFIELPQVADVEKQIEVLEQRITDTKRSEKILSLKAPITLTRLTFDLQDTFQLLEKQIDDLANNAEELVHSHLNNYASDQMEDWLSRGQILLEENCPFCGQNITNTSLIQAYRSYFSREYNALKASVNKLITNVDQSFGNHVASQIENTISANDICLDTWQEHVPFSMPELDVSLCKETLTSLHKGLKNLAKEKQKQPLEIIGLKKEHQELDDLQSKINQMVDLYNSQIDELSAKIRAYQETIRAEDPQSLKTEQEQLSSQQKRQAPEIIKYIKDYKKAVQSYEKLKAEKDRVRSDLDHLMNSTLEKYQERVNELIEQFHGNFSIEKMKADYKSKGNPRSDYSIVIRGNSIKLGKRDDMYKGHSFGNVLSEADKRTLAFAFFIARLEKDPQLDKRIVIFDDPVSSLDMNRRRETIRTIANLANECKQLIILSHDVYFARDLRNKLEDPYPSSIQPKMFEIRRANNGYSTFDACDVDSVCASPYYHHYNVVYDYVYNNCSTSSRDVAKAIRPLLEGYLHRRFPKRIPRDQTFGQVINFIKNANSSDVLSNLGPIADALADINTYVSDFHHDTNPDADRTAINETELHSFAKKAIDIILKVG